MKILITGGTGSLGNALVPVLLQQNHEVIILSRDFHKQDKLTTQYPTIHAVIADICDRDAMLRACEDQDIVIHAAAIKAVNHGDTNTRQYHRVNIMGTINVAEACRLNGVSKALFVSSDKAVSSVNTYGMTKAIGERLWLAEQTPRSATLFCCVRYGNVVSSNGSVWRIWKDRVTQNLPLIVREPEPTRFFLSLTDAVKVVTDAIYLIQGKEIFIPSAVPAFSLWDLAQELQPAEQWQYEPLGSTEKQHEILVAPTEWVEPVNAADTNLWRIWPTKSNPCQVTPKQFCSQTAHRLTGKEVIAKING